MLKIAKWHKIKKARQKKSSSRSLKRMMKRVQQDPNMDIQEIPGVSEILIKSSRGNIKILNPQSVSMMQIPGQGNFYQIIGGTEEAGEVITSDIEEPIERKEIELKEESIEAIEIPLEDIQLVSQQAGASEDEAKEALIKNNGDLAKAIISLRK